MKTKVANINIAAVRSVLLFLLVTASLVVRSQAIYPQVIVSAGDYYNNGSYSISWTLGEIMTETFTNGNNILTQGFQQDSYVIIGTKDQQVAGFNINVYPNPASEFIKVDLQNPDKGNYFIDLIDNQGRRLLSKQITSDRSSFTETINLIGIPAGIYFLKVTSATKSFVRTYKLIHQ